MYCESQPKHAGKTWVDLFPEDVFPSDTPEDKTKSECGNVAILRELVYSCHPWADQQCSKGSGLLTQVQTHAMETWGRLTWLFYRWWPANTGTNTCYGDFEAH